MPKIGTRNLRAGEFHTSKILELPLYYFEGSMYSKAKFLLVLPENYRETISGKVESHSNRGKRYYGFSGVDEKEAISRTKEYLDWFTTQAQTKTPVILIRTGEKDFSMSRSRVRPTQSLYESHIVFGFKKAYWIEIEGKRKYFEDGTYHVSEYGDKSDSEVSSINDYTVLPFNQNMLEKCEAIVAKLNQADTKIRDLFDTEEAALVSLSAQTPLKLLSSKSA